MARRPRLSGAPTVDLRGAARIVDFYRENGPSQLWRLTLEDPCCRFRLDGYYTLLVGQRVPHRKLDAVSERENAAWRRLQAATRQYASTGFSVPDTLAYFRAPDWQWQPENFAA